MILITVDVILRYAFNKPITGSFDIAQYLMAILVAGGIAYCALKKGHTVVDIVVSHMPIVAKNILNALTYFVCATMMAVLCWRLIDYTISTYKSGLSSSVLPIPNYPFIAFVTFCFLVFSLAFLAVGFEYLTKK